MYQGCCKHFSDLKVGSFFQRHFYMASSNVCGPDRNMCHANFTYLWDPNLQNRKLNWSPAVLCSWFYLYPDTHGLEPTALIDLSFEKKIGLGCRSPPASTILSFCEIVCWHILCCQRTYPQNTPTRWKILELQNWQNSSWWCSHFCDIGYNQVSLCHSWYYFFWRIWFHGQQLWRSFGAATT